MSLNRKNEADEARLISDLNATFPGVDATSLRQWSGHSDCLGAVVSGEARMPDGLEIGPYIAPEIDEYDGYIHQGFEAWLNARGWYVELYEPGTLWVVPIPEIAASVDRLTAAWFPPPKHLRGEVLPF